MLQRPGTAVADWRVRNADGPSQDKTSGQNEICSKGNLYRLPIKSDSYRMSNKRSLFDCVWAFTTCNKQNTLPIILLYNWYYLQTSGIILK